MTAGAALLPLALLAVMPARAAAVEWQWELAAEARYFSAAPADPGQHRGNLSGYLQAEMFHDFDDSRQRVVFAPFVRADQGDSERSHADLREFYWRYSYPDVDVYVGLRRVFWGATEALHLIDIINQTDLVENPDTEDKLGQPMVQLSVTRDWGTWDAFFMPLFRERTFPGPRGRLRTPLPVADDAARYESAQGRHHLDFALRYSHSVGPVELGLAHFTGTGREPRLIPVPGPAPGSASFVPVYEQIDQTSLDLTAVTGGWLWKLEALSRRDQAGRFSAFTGGLEYTVIGLGASSWDLGLIAEYQYDQRGALFSAFQNDLAVGGRLALNDAHGTQVLVLGAVDRDSSGRLFSVEGSRRLGNSMRLSLEGRWFSADQPDDALFFIRQDDYLQLELTRFF